MEKLSDAKVFAIKKRYLEIRNLSQVAREYSVDPRTVKKCIGSKESAPSKPPAAVPGNSQQQLQPIQQRLQQPDKEAARARKEDKSLPVVPSHSEDKKFPEAVKLLDAGKSITEVIVLLKLRPEQAERFYAKYTRLKAGERFYQMYAGNSSRLEAIVDLSLALERERLMDPVAINTKVKQLGSFEGYRKEAEKEEAHLKTAIEERNRVRQSLESLRAESVVLRQKLDAMQSAYNNMARKNANLTREIPEKEGRLRTLNDQVARLETVLDVLRSRRGPILSEIDAIVVAKAQEILKNNNLMLDIAVSSVLLTFRKHPDYLALFSGWCFGKISQQDTISLSNNLFGPMLQEMYSQLLTSARNAAEVIAAQMYL